MVNNKNQDIAVYLLYLFISLLAIREILMSDYFLSIDWSDWGIVPKIDISNNFFGLRGYSSFIYAELPFLILLKIIGTVLPSWHIQKLIILFIIWTSGIFAYNIISTKSRLSKFYSGLIYMINPFIYSRLLAGQWAILLAYSLVPFFIKGLIDDINNSNRNSIIKLLIILSIINIFSIHILIITLIIMTIIFLFWFNKYRDTRILKIIILSIIIFVLLNTYWIIPVMTTKNTIIDNIVDKDIEIFAPNIEKNIYGWFEIAAMYGFWREGYIYTKDILPGWQILYLIILSLAIIGFLGYYKDEKIGYLVKAMVVVGIVGFILATGIKGPFGDQIYWLFDNTILKGFRDSHKFVAMIVLSYSFLGGLGIDKIKNMIKK